MDANSAPKKTFRSVQKRVVEEVKMSNESASGLGFHNLPFLVHRKSVKKGFEFTLMVVGEFVVCSAGCIGDVSSTTLVCSVR